MNYKPSFNLALLQLTPCLASDTVPLTSLTRQNLWLLLKSNTTFLFKLAIRHFLNRKCQHVKDVGMPTQGAGDDQPYTSYLGVLPSLKYTFLHSYDIQISIVHSPLLSWEIIGGSIQPTKLTSTFASKANHTLGEHLSQNCKGTPQNPHC